MQQFLQVLLGIVCLAAFSPAACQRPTDIKRILLTESTRGVQRSIEVTREYTTVVVNDDSSRTATRPDTWEALLKLATDIPPAKVPGLRSGGTRHQTDAALQSQLVIETATDTYGSPSFDHTQPPQELTRLQQALYGLVPSGWKERFGLEE
jgi:hypothetical protein